MFERWLPGGINRRDEPFLIHSNVETYQINYIIVQFYFNFNLFAFFQYHWSAFALSSFIYSISSCFKPAWAVLNNNWILLDLGLICFMFPFIVFVFIYFDSLSKNYSTTIAFFNYLWQLLFLLWWLLLCPQLALLRPLVNGYLFFHLALFSGSFLVPSTFVWFRFETNSTTSSFFNYLSTSDSCLAFF
jgi:hypothetical protein